MTLAQFCEKIALPDQVTERVLSVPEVPEALLVQLRTQKLESCWDEAVFIRQKTYAEHVTHENLEPIEAPFWEVKCAGMPDTCKELFLHSFKPYVSHLLSKGVELTLRHKPLTPDEVEFLTETRTIEDFKVGLKVPGKLMPHHIDGGIVLQSDYYTMKRSVFFL